MSETQETKQAASSLSAIQRCEAFIDDIIKEVNTVQYLMWSINNIGGSISRHHIKCIDVQEPSPPIAVAATDVTATSSVQPAAKASPPQLPAAAREGIAKSSVQAGYIWSPTMKGIERGQIVLRADKITSKETAERSLRHELVHAYDDARGFIDPQDCLHHACSEIRAARLSGDCLGLEVKHNWTDPMSSGLQCVRRRAILAVENNPVCKDFSERAVEKTFPKCYSDYEPFVAPIYGMGNYGFQSVNLETGEFEGGYFQRWKEMSSKK
ncbi:aminomethyltransferase, mitochondrial, putative [Bodo saltans]|uniref:Mitochondrial inner membrane protease ATP23 n=1 Tax=Bodo saltans TaxID=75058 RepID=A0A0S4IYE0_BODSA|nr:aminomethyltransferase, mitochondrial, putative [Bodo saltans]|eukprot:CUG06195.1 aminomethyltransferase, mitochondrial, putative [Bodo saltans]